AGRHLLLPGAGGGTRAAARSRTRPDALSRADAASRHQDGRFAVTAHAIGIDVGGSAVKLGLVSAGGDILARRRLGVEKEQDFASFAARLSGAVAELRASRPEHVSAIGLAMPGF